MYSVSGFRTSYGRVSPLGDLRILGCLSPSRSLSQIATSFIGFWCQGIHHIPLLVTTKNTVSFFDVLNWVSNFLYDYIFYNYKLYKMLLNILIKCLKIVFTCQSSDRQITDSEQPFIKSRKPTHKKLLAANYSVF